MDAGRGVPTRRVVVLRDPSTIGGSPAYFEGAPASRVQRKPVRHKRLRSANNRGDALKHWIEREERISRSECREQELKLPGA